VADPSAPSWERPRRFEAYPSLKSSGGRVAALPRPVLYGLIVLIVGVALFATPFVLRVLTSGDGASSSPTPAASASAAATVAPSITPVPSPSPTIYVVKAGDVLSRLAVKFGVTVDAIVKANPQIKNPDRLNLGDQLVIPPAVAPAITDGAITPAP
jgi:LysM repeat protein